MNPPATRSNARHRLAFVLALVVAGLLIGVVRRRADPVPATLAALEAEGFPVTRAAITARYPPVPDDRNVITAIQPVLLQISEQDFPDRTNAPTPVRGAAPTPLWQATWPPLVAASSSALRHLHLGLQRPAAWIPDWANLGPDLKVYPTVRLLAAASVSAAEDDDPNAAAGSLADLFRLAWATDGSPILFLQLSSDYWRLEGIRAAEHVLNRRALPIAALKTLEAALESTTRGEASDLPAAHQLVMGWQEHGFENVVQAGRASTQPWPVRVKSWAYSILYGASDRRLIFNLDVQRLRQTHRPLFERLRAADEELTQLTQLSATVQRRFLPSPWGLVIQSPRSVIERHASVRGRLLAARTACAVERWRLDHPGQLPNSLADLVPGYLASVPSDPIDAQPLRYRRTAKGYCLYSIGLNRADDGGLEGSPDENRPYDDTFIVERP